MADVTLYDRAWTDPRFDCLDKILGLGDRDLALIKVAKIWAWQTERFEPGNPTYIVPRAIVIGVLGLNGPEAMIESGLAEPAEGGLYIAGSEGRVEWKSDIRSKQSAAGHARTDGKPPRVSGRFVRSTAKPEIAAENHQLTSHSPATHQPLTSHSPATNQQGTSLEPASTSPSSSSSSEDLSPPARDPCTTEPVPYVVVPAPGAVGALVQHAKERLNEARQSIDPKSQPLPLFGGQPEASLADRIRETPPDSRRERLDHALDVLIAEATASGSVANLRLAQLGGDRAWQRLQSMTIADARAPTRHANRRDGPSRSPSTTLQPRTVKRLA